MKLWVFFKISLNDQEDMLVSIKINCVTGKTERKKKINLLLTRLIMLV